MPVEWWKSFFEIGGVVLLFLTFAFGAGFMLTGKIVSDRQEQQLRQFDKDLTEAKTELGRQQERAAGAEKSLLELQTRLADRTLSAQQRTSLVDQLKPWAGLDIDVLVWGDSAEIEIISGQILESLTNAGWHLHTGHSGGGGGAVRGILVGTRSDADDNTALGAKTLISALQSASLASGPWKFDDMRIPSVTLNSSFTNTAPVRMFIGSKPPN